MSTYSFPDLPDANPRLQSHAWSAAWAKYPLGSDVVSAVYLYRCVIELAAVPRHFLIHVTADQRYRLRVNGMPVCWGPARGDLQHWRYETVDIAAFLKPGENVLTATVHFLSADLAPMAQMSTRAAFLCQGDTEAASGVNTPGTWKVLRCDAYAFDRREADALHAYCVIDPSEHFDASRYPWGWESAEFDDSGWEAATRAGTAAPYGLANAETAWWLVRRGIPAMEETPQRFAGLARSSGVVVPAGWPNSPVGSPLILPANTRAVLLFDSGVETTAFPRLIVSGGAGAHLRLAYSESLLDPGAPPHDYWLAKGQRDKIADRTLRGYADTWLLDGGADRTLNTLWWRTFRFAELTIETADQPITLQDISSVYTGYPFDEKARFTAPEVEDLADILAVGWRTARLCAHETYMDCPYYEQLQYAGDTRIQCLVSYYVSGDHRLWRNALQQLDDSRITDGLTQSRYPSRVPQIIAPFSLWYVCMIHDYGLHVADDVPFLRSLLRGARGVLEWFEARLRPDGLLGPLDWWNFVDWCDAWPMGVPPGVQEGGSAILTLQFSLACRAFAELLAGNDDPNGAKRWAGVAGGAAGAVWRHCFDAERGLIADTAEKRTYSQHANILALLADAVPVTVADRSRLMERVLSDGSLTQATFYFRFYLNRALIQAGLGDRYLETLGPWREMLRLGLTTWAEKPEPTRSDCHAWSSAPNYEFLATVLGVVPDAPGFARVRIAPYIGSLTSVQGTVPHPRGEVSVALRRTGDTLQADITLPSTIDGVFVWRGVTRELRGGRSSLEISAEAA